MRRDFDTLAAAVRRKVVDVRVESRLPDELVLRAHFDGYGDYFTVRAMRVSYVDLAIGFESLGGLRLLSLDELAAARAKYRALRDHHDGAALLLWSDHDELAGAPDDAVYTIVANDFTFEPGPHWPSELEPTP